MLFAKVVIDYVDLRGTRRITRHHLGTLDRLNFNCRQGSNLPRRYAASTKTQGERTAWAKINISASFSVKQQAFFDSMLAPHIAEGLRELDQDKLTPLLRLKYH